MLDKNLNEENILNPEELEEVTATEVKAEIVSEVIDELGTINETTVVTGDIETKGHLAIAGTVNGSVSAKGNIIIAGSINGDVKAKGNIIVTGMVKGDIRCCNLVLENCKLNTNIEVEDKIQIKQGSEVVGDIKCKDITVDGAVEGNIDAIGTLAIASNASVKGNVKAKSIGMGFGGKLTGNISMHEYN